MKLKIILHNVQSTAFFEQMLTVLDLELGIYSAEKLVLSIKKHPDWNMGLQKASTFSFKDSALAKYHKRSDKWVEDVKRRLSKSTGSCRNSTASKVFKYRAISCPYFPVFGLNAKIY